MKNIYKYLLKITDRQAIGMTVGAEILSVQMQGNRMTMWALVDSDSLKEEVRIFDLYGTGEAMPDNPGEYIATVQDQSLVWHIFEDMP